MDFQQLLDELPQELRQRGIPDEYIVRYVDELRDHITDLTEERTSHMSKDARTDAEDVLRIGTPTVLADAARAEFARRTFCGRHPIVTFLVAPIPLAVFAWIATFVALFGCGTGVTFLIENLGYTPWTDSVASWPAAAVLAAMIVFWLCVVGPPAALTLLLCRLAHRSGLSWHWPLAGCLLVALIAGLFQAVLEPSPAGDGHGRVMFGFGLWTFPPLRQWLQFAVPLLIGFGLLWRQTHRPDRTSDPLPDATIANRQAA